MLNNKLFATIIRHTPLISIDFIVKNSDNQILLGKRLNEPARGFWFVPGGRIYKNERLTNAFKRLSSQELGTVITQDKATFLGVFDHFYDNNVYNQDFSTHYIVLAHQIYSDILPNNTTQHDRFQWFDVEQFLQDNTVHPYTKHYFTKDLV